MPGVRHLVVILERKVNDVRMSSLLYFGKILYQRLKGLTLRCSGPRPLTRTGTNNCLFVCLVFFFSTAGARVSSSCEQASRGGIRQSHYISGPEHTVSVDL